MFPGFLFATEVYRPVQAISREFSKSAIGLETSRSGRSLYKRFPCPNCTSTFMWKCTLRKHMRYECGQEPRFKCPYCDFRCKWKGNTCRHIQRMHKNCKIYVVSLK